MSLPDPEPLLAACAELPGPARERRLGELGHTARRDPGYRAWVEGLRRDDAFVGLCVVSITRAARDVDTLLDLLDAPHRSVRLAAANAAARLLAPGRLDPRLLDAIPSDARTRLVTRLASRGSTAVAEPLFPHVRDAWPELAPVVLPHCSAFTVENHLDAFAHAIRDWRTTAHRHPRLLLDWLRERMDADGRSRDPESWAECHAALDALGPERPVETLRLALACHPAGVAPTDLPRALRAWCRAAPDLLLDWIVSALGDGSLQAPLPRRLRSIVRDLSADGRRRLARAAGERPDLAGAFLERLPPSERAAYWSVWLDEARGVPRTLSGRAVRAADHRSRAASGKALLRQVAVRSTPEARLTALSLLLPDEALERGAADLSHTDPPHRAAAWTAVARSGVAYVRLTPVLDALASADRAEPVLRAVGEVVLEAAPRVFLDEDVAHLRRLLEAVDPSLAVSFALRLLADELERSAGELLDLALDTLELHAERLPGVATTLRRLPARRARALLHRLLPRLRTDVGAGRTELATTLLRTLHRRGVHDEAVATLLRDAATTESGAALALAVRHGVVDPDRLAAPEPALLVDRTVARRIARAAPEQFVRCVEGLTADAAPPAGLADAWELPHDLWARQARAVRDMADAAEGDALRATWVGAYTNAPGATLAATLPLVDAAATLPRRRLRPRLARLDDRRGLPDVALRHLGEGGAGLLSALARVTAPPDLARGLRTHAGGPAPLPPLVALRASIHLPRPLAAVRFDELPSSGLDATEGRQAALAPALRLLHEEAAWRLLHGFARSPRPAEVRALLSVSRCRIAPAHRARFARLVLAATRHPEPRVRRRAFLAAGRWARGDERAFAEAAARRVAQPASRSGWRAAVTLLGRLARHPAAQEPLDHLVRDLTLLPTAVEHDAGDARDLPGRQRLRALVQTLVAPDADAPASLLRALARRAGATGPHAVLAARLLVASLDWSDPGSTTRPLRRWCPPWDELGILDRVLPEVERSLSRADHAWTKDAPLVVAAALLDAGAAAGRVAVLILEERARRRLWTEDARKLLRALRRHAEPTVRLAARDLFTVPE